MSSIVFQYASMMLSEITSPRPTDDCSNRTIGVVMSTAPCLGISATWSYPMSEDWAAPDDRGRNVGREVLRGKLALFPTMISCRAIQRDMPHSSVAHRTSDLRVLASNAPPDANSESLA